MNLTPTLEASLSGLLEEVETRPVRLTSIPTVEFPASSNVREFLAFPGTVSVYVAKKGSGVLDEIRAALGKGPEVASALMNRLHKPAVGKTSLPLEEAANRIAGLPVFAEIRFGGRVLMQSMCVPDGFEVCMAALPYNGGALDKGQLTLAQYFQSDASYELEAVALVHAPPLTPLQKAALSQLSEEEAARNVGSGSRCYALCATAVTLAVTVAATLCCGTSKSAAAWEAAERSAAMTDDEVKKLGPAATARQLLKLRRNVLRDECPAN